MAIQISPPPFSAADIGVSGLTDNRLIRADGSDSLQGSGITVDDSGDMDLDNNDLNSVNRIQLGLNNQIRSSSGRAINFMTSDSARGFTFDFGSTGDPLLAIWRNTSGANTGIGFDLDGTSGGAAPEMKLSSSGTEAFRLGDPADENFIDVSANFDTIYLIAGDWNSAPFTGIGVESPGQVSYFGAKHVFYNDDWAGSSNTALSVTTGTADLGIDVGDSGTNDFLLEADGGSGAIMRFPVGNGVQFDTSAAGDGSAGLEVNESGQLSFLSATEMDIFFGLGKAITCVSGTGSQTDLRIANTEQIDPAKVRLFASGGVKVEDNSYLTHANYTDATRPDPTAVDPGTEIWNTDDGAPNWSDGTNWVDATGATT